MKAVHLVYYPQVKRAVDYYVASSCYRGEKITRVEEFEEGSLDLGELVILGRGSHFHHYDLRHIDLLRDRGKLPGGHETTLVLYDWHEDLDHDPRGTQLGNGTWAYVGLMNDMYANVYVVGVNPRGFNELNSFLFDQEEVRPTSEETLRLLDRVCLYPSVSGYYCLKLFPECEQFLRENPSVDRHFVVPEGGFVVVKFNGSESVVYKDRKAAVVVSVDLDVLRRSELRSDCPQGAMSVDGLLTHFDRLRQTGPINAFLLCGLTESQDEQDEASLQSVARVLSRCSEVLGGSE